MESLDLQLERLHELVGFALKKGCGGIFTVCRGRVQQGPYLLDELRTCGRLVVEFSDEGYRLIQQLLVSVTREKTFHLFKLADDLILALSSSLDRGRTARVTTAENGQALAEFFRWPKYSDDRKRLNFGEVESRLRYLLEVAKKRPIEVTRLIGIVIPAMRENE